MSFELKPSSPSSIATVESEKQLRGTTVQCVDSTAAWQALSKDWDRLSEMPLHQYAWLQSWWSHVGQPSGKLAIACVRTEQEVIGFAPFFVTRSWMGNTLRFLGSGPACTDYLDLFCRSEHAEMVGAEVADWLQGPDFLRRFGRVDLVELEGHVESAPGITALQAHLDAAGWRTETCPLEGCWVVSFPQNWDEYLASLSHRQRRRVRHAEKMVNSGKLRFVIHDHADSFDELWQNFVQLHQKRRKDKGQAGCFAETGFERFLTEAVQRLFDQRQAVFASVYLEEHPIAMGLQLQGTDRRYLYQTGMDIDHLKLEPGHVLNALSLQHSWKMGLGHFDFLRGDEPYKASWNAKPTPLLRTRLWNTHLSAKLRAQVARTARFFKQWAHKPASSTNNE